LDGNFFHIGPGLWDLSPTFSFKDWLDGYGQLSQFSLSSSTTKSTVSFSSTFIQSNAYKTGCASGYPHFTEFGTVAHAYDQNQGIFSKMMSSIGSIVISFMIYDQLMATIL
jgi:hypothetical protein